jgi:glutamate synthase domain-containing protein 2
MGMPLREGLVFVHDTLVGYGLRKEMKVIVAGKIITGFHVARAIALGADGCNSARAMMLSIGCIQALQCNNNTCPVGVATQNKSLVKGLVVEDKAPRAERYHNATIQSFLELIAAAGLNGPEELSRNHISKRVGSFDIKTYDEIYPYLEENSLLNENTIPQEYKKFFQLTRMMK